MTSFCKTALYNCCACAYFNVFFHVFQLNANLRYGHHRVAIESNDRNDFPNRRVSQQGSQTKDQDSYLLLYPTNDPEAATSEC